MNVSKNAKAAKSIDWMLVEEFSLRTTGQIFSRKTAVIVTDEAFEAIDPETQPEIGTNEAAGIEASARQQYLRNGA